MQKTLILALRVHPSQRKSVPERVKSESIRMRVVRAPKERPERHRRHPKETARLRVRLVKYM